MFENILTKETISFKDLEEIAFKIACEFANEILRNAEAQGVEGNFFFKTTFQRYLVQIKMLSELEQAIKDDGYLVEKEYVKGRKNVYSHPAISDYNGPMKLDKII